MRDLDWTTQSDGSLAGVAYHDGKMAAIDLAPGRSLRFRVKNLSDAVVQLELQAIREFTLVELWDGAIVSDIYVWRARSVPDVMWQVPDGGWNALLRTRADSSNIAGMARKIALREPEPLLVVVDCSYGGQLAAVCGALRITEEDG